MLGRPPGSPLFPYTTLFRSTESATVATLDTAGRAVMVAGSTVVVSMLGLFAMGLSFMRGAAVVTIAAVLIVMLDRKSTRLNSSHVKISYAVFCLKKKKRELG